MYLWKIKNIICNFLCRVVLSLVQMCKSKLLKHIFKSFIVYILFLHFYFFTFYIFIFSIFENLLKYIPPALGEMAEWLWALSLLKYEDQSLNPQNTRKSAGTMLCFCNNRKESQISQNMVEGRTDILYCLLISIQVMQQTCACTHTHNCAHVYQPAFTHMHMCTKNDIVH